MKLFNKVFITGCLMLVSQAQAATDYPVINLTKRNTVVMRDIIDSSSVTNLQEKVVKLSHNLSKDEEIHLYLNTPGGDIGAGQELINTLKGLPQKVDTISNFAASMGFVTVQSLGDRYVLPNGILMSHRARGGAAGQIPGELNTRVKFFTESLDREDSKIAKRVGMTKQAYQNLIINEYWVDGEEAVKNHMADKVVEVRCDRELSEGRSTETVQTFFGPVRLVYSDCPLISAPLEIDFGGLMLNEYREVDAERIVMVRKAILELAFNKSEFYHNYILTNKIKDVMP